MNDELDALMQDDLLQAPADFTQRVMQRIQPRPQPASSAATPAKAAPQRWRRLRWLATATGLVGGGLLGLSQLASFVFGLWLASTAI
jgi:predicted lipid-binding transport protein (Tim44 family)